MTPQRVIGCFVGGAALALAISNPSPLHYRQQIIEPVIAGARAVNREAVDRQLPGARLLGRLLFPDQAKEVRSLVNEYWAEQADTLMQHTTRRNYLFLSDYVLTLDGCRSIAVGLFGSVWMTANDGCGLSSFLNKAGAS
jgi:hypothetical protein